MLIGPVDTNGYIVDIPTDVTLTIV
jgi:hypothetical protein